VVFDECMAAVELLEFGEESGGDVAWALKGAEEGLHRFLPAFYVGAACCGEDLARGSKSVV